MLESVCEVDGERVGKNKEDQVAAVSSVCFYTVYIPCVSVCLCHSLCSMVLFLLSLFDAFSVKK